MAIYHLSVKTISRSAGRSATAAAAYRAAEKIVDEQTGEVHDYTRKGGVESATLILPKDAPEWASARSQLWNRAEQAETRKNATVAREFEIALPAELSKAQREKLAHEFAREIVERHGCAADVCIHEPSQEGDERNHHAHILLSTRMLEADGFTTKTRELDDKTTGPLWVKQWREQFAELQNEHLRQAGSEARVDHRSLEAQGIERSPQPHLGPAATGYERRTGEASVLRQRHQQEAMAKDQAQTALKTNERTIEHLTKDLAHEKERRRYLEQRHWEGMSTSELAKAIARRTPEAVDTLLGREASVFIAKVAYEKQLSEHRVLEKTHQEAKRDEQKWRESHRILAKLHDMGMRSKDLSSLELHRHACQEKLSDAAPHLAASKAALEAEQAAARERIEAEQASTLELLTEMEAYRRRRVEQEETVKEDAKTLHYKAMAQAFQRETPEEAMQKYPELAGGYAAMEFARREVNKRDFTPQQREQIMNRFHENAIESIENGVMPKLEVQVKIKKREEPTITRSPSRGQGRDLDR